jgi:serine/threonine protein kinase
MAPETWDLKDSPLKKYLGPKQKPKFSESSDVWSFGLLFWELFGLGSDTPLQELWVSEQLFYMEIKLRLKRGCLLNIHRNCPESVHQIMQLCWREDPSKRPTFGTIEEKLQALIQKWKSQDSAEYSAHDTEDEARPYHNVPRFLDLSPNPDSNPLKSGPELIQMPLLPQKTVLNPNVTEMTTQQIETNDYFGDGNDEPHNCVGIDYMPQENDTEIDGYETNSSTIASNGYTPFSPQQ